MGLISAPPCFMANEKLRQRIVFEAARLMYCRQEAEYYRAKMKAARKICRGWVKPSDLPSNREIRDEIQRFAYLYEGETRTENLKEMRVEALRIMRLLEACRPRLIGSTLTGHVRQGSDIDIHVFPRSLEAVTGALDDEGIDYFVERKRVRKHGEERTFTHVHIKDRFPVEITVYPADKAHYVFKSSITGKGIERASLPELEALLTHEYPQLELDQAVVEAEGRIDRFQLYRSLLLPLQHVRENWRYHPESDALYHSLQVYQLACDEMPYDEEFLLAALLHDVGKAIDAVDHVQSALEALEDWITERTAWFIEHHMQAHALRDGTIGARARRRLQQHDDFDALVLLGECDRNGRVPGAEVPELEDALDSIRDLSNQYG